MTEIAETITVKGEPAALVALNLYEIKKILKRRFKTMEGIVNPSIYEMKFPDAKIKFYKKHCENINAINAALYALQNILEKYIKEIEEQNAMQAKEENAEQ